ncbi:metallophosphoesterase [Alkanindiges illinoisensis]|uniref:metallophosphoesterase n=1 Tax=Alkanindiges illinoisensis TaxID=197183 RepID=UPI00047B657E|nr:metallophosphoesterase [Alkanindiges illinoisensis]
MNQAVKIWNKEIKGHLFAVGDLHGCYNLLMLKLQQIGFDFENDLLVSVGDLVDRGIQNLECIGLLDQPWFTAVRGNHEQLCIDALVHPASKRCHVGNGGEWFYELDDQQQDQIVKKFKKLPYVLEIDHKGEKFGFVHGHIEQNDWEQFKQTFQDKDRQRGAKDLAIWGRERFDMNPKHKTVTGVDAVIMGHTVTPKPFKRDNCYFIDTGAVHWGTLTVMRLG